MKRNEIDNKYKWKLEDIFETDALWEQDFKKMQDILPTLKDLKTGFLDSAQSLLDALVRIDEASLLCERLYVYAKMRRDEDNSNALYQGMTDRAMTLYVAVSGETSFVAPALTATDSKTLEAYISEEKGLSPYAFMIRNIIRLKKHVLSEPEEKLLSMSADFASGARNIFTMLNNVDLKFGSVETEDGPVQLTHATYIKLMQNKNRQVRKDAYETYYSAFAGSINTISAAYATSVKKDVFYASARGYESALEKALFGDNVPLSLYDGLIDCIHDNLDIMHDYVDLRKKLLGLDDIGMHDIYVPLVAGTDEKYSYEQAMNMTIDALTPMGSDYLQLLRRAQNESWIDVFESEGKTSGAYSWGPYGTHPYVLLNHRGDLDSVFTIAHELGHAMHSWYSEQNQPYPTASYTIFVAEVASTVNEILLTKHLLEHGSEKLKRYALCHYLDQFRTTVLRQTMFAEFEKISHAMCEQGQPLTNENLSQAYAQLNAQYYGSGMTQDDTIPLEWARIPHFYNAFYVYKYATGFSAAVMLATDIYAQKPGALERYIAFLSSGGSDHPLALLKNAGVDFDGAAPVHRCMNEFRAALKNFKAVMDV